MVLAFVLSEDEAATGPGDRVLMTSLGRTSTALLLLAAATVGVSRPARGYVRYESATGVPFAWKNSCVWLTAFPAELPLLTRDQTSEAMAAAVATWSKQNPTVGACSYLDLRLTVADASAPVPAAANDGMNIIRVRTDTWCPKPPNCYDLAALAMTTVSARTSTGEIIDADTEINAVTFSWADVTRNAPTGNEQDLQNALTHEMGHLIGLDHTCSLSGIRPTDQNGNPIPDCANASAAVVATTMFPSANPLDTNKRTLADDDVMGVCGIYPVLLDPMACPPPGPRDAGTDAEPPDASADAPPDDAPGDSESTPPPKDSGCGCAVPGLGAPTPAALLAAALLFVVRRRRRR